jgi:hypothetical protein
MSNWHAYFPPARNEPHFLCAKWTGIGVGPQSPFLTFEGYFQPSEQVFCVSNCRNHGKGLHNQGASWKGQCRAILGENATQILRKNWFVLSLISILKPEESLETCLELKKFFLSFTEQLLSGKDYHNLCQETEPPYCSTSESAQTSIPSHNRLRKEL